MKLEDLRSAAAVGELEPEPEAPYEPPKITQQKSRDEVWGLDKIKMPVIGVDPGMP